VSGSVERADGGRDAAEGDAARDGAVLRRSAKVIVIDLSGHVLLFRGRDLERPADGTWWFPPGGGVERDESDEEAAFRELLEETGLAVAELGAPVGTRRATFRFEGGRVESDEVYFAVRVDRFEPDAARWTDAERRTIVEHRWWSRQELLATTETVYPERLLTMLEREA
jgi:8-oxo-dGTP pyrophosphatase MutT (NUDIX family)